MGLRVIRVAAVLSSLCHSNSHPEAHKQGPVRFIREQLCDEVKLYLLFLNFCLATVNAFNVGITYTTIDLPYHEMKNLTKGML